MKNLKRMALLVLAVVMANASIVLANDAEGPDAEVSVRQIQSEQKKAIIRITNVSSDEPAVLRIKDTQGYVLHREVISQSEAYAKKYDFSNLPSGDYLVELSTSDGIIKESFELEAGRTNPRYFKPAVQVEPGLIKVAFINRISSPVSLKLYDERGEVLYEETVPSQEKFAKGLNISKLNAGQYSLAVLGDNYVYSKSIQVK